MDPHLYTDLDGRLISQLKDWTPGDVPFCIDEVQHNLIYYIGKGCLKEGVELMFTTEFSMAQSKSYSHKDNKERRDKLVRSLKFAASEAGFTLVNKGWDAGELKIYLRCQRSWIYKDKRKNKSTQSSTLHPINKDQQ